MHDTIFLSACNLINLYKSKKLSPVENLKNTFDVIKKLNPKLNAFISIAEKKAMKQAKLSELYYLNSTERKLEGIPFGIKDVIDVQQEKTMNGSKLFEKSELKRYLINTKRTESIGSLRAVVAKNFLKSNKVSFEKIYDICLKLKKT